MHTCNHMHDATCCMNMPYSMCLVTAPRRTRSLQQQPLSRSCNANSTDRPHALASESPEEAFNHAVNSSKQYTPLSIDVTPVLTLQSGSKSERSSYSDCPADCNVCCSASCILQAQMADQALHSPFLIHTDACQAACEHCHSASARIAP